MHLEQSPTGPGTGRILLRYWAAARAAAGVESDSVEAERPLTVAELVAEALRRHSDAAELARVLSTCSVLVDDQPSGRVDHSEALVPPGAVVEFLPPFAGG